MRVVYIYDSNRQEDASSQWRCRVPARAINRTRRHQAELLDLKDFIQNTQAARAACRPADVLVVERELQGPVLPAIQHWQARNKWVIADFDAAFPRTPAANPGTIYWKKDLPGPGGQGGDTAWQKNGPLPLVQFKWGLRLVDGVTVPSLLLADDWRSFNAVEQVPNYIELENYLNVSPPAHEGVVLGWGGSGAHLQAFMNSGLAPALRRICHLRPQVRVMLCGNQPQLLDQLGLPEEQVIQRPWVPYEEWAKHLCHFDIGLAPLAGDYDDRRSWIRVLEYMVMKIPWVASASPAYHQLSPFGWMVKNDPADWEGRLVDMVDHLDDYRVEAAGEPYFYGMGQSIDDNIDRVLNTYANIGKRPLPQPASAACASPGYLTSRFFNQKDGLYEGE